MSDDRGTLGPNPDPYTPVTPPTAPGWATAPVAPPHAPPNPTPNASPLPAPPPATPSSDRQRVLPVAILAAVAASIAAAALIVALVAGKNDSSGSDRSKVAVVGESTIAGATASSASANVAATTATTGAPITGGVAPTTLGGSTVRPTRTTQTAPDAGSVGAIDVAEITASATRPSANLYCTGELMSYRAQNLLDGDPDTGWGAGRGDGTAQSVDVTFDGPRHIRRISISPGYLRVGPRRDLGCTDVSAFRYNRIITGVRYDFDDGTSVVQQLDADPTMQSINVDVVSTSARVTILGTVLPPGADTDTIISDLQFEGDM